MVLPARTRSGEVQALDEPTRVRVLQRHLDVAILRDLIERHEIVTLATDEAIRVAEGTIRAVPLWRWAIERSASGPTAYGLQPTA